MDRSRFRQRCQRRRRDLIIQAPSDIVGPGLATGTPPGVLLGSGVEPAKDIDESDLVEDPGQPGPFFGQEPRVLLIRLPVLQVDCLVGDVPVTAQHDLPAARFQVSKMRLEGFDEAKLRLLALGRGRTGWDIHRNHGEIAEVSFDITPFGIELFTAKPRAYSLRCLVGIQAHAAVALFLREMKMPACAGQFAQGLIEIGLLSLDLLDTQHIRPMRFEPLCDTFALSRAQAIEVERDDPQHLV